MAKPISTLAHLVGRVVKGLVGVLLIPPVLGLVVGLSQQLGTTTVGSRLGSQWFGWGVLTYAGWHLLCYKPTALFGVSHALLARLAVWLFGGQVATVGAESSKKAKGSAKTKGAATAAHGSTLVVLSPYLVPCYAILVGVLAWVAAHWVSSELLTGVFLWCMGASLMFHIAMTADDLQQDLERVPVEMYLMALAISSFVSLFVVSVCLPMIVPGFSVPATVAEAMATTHTIYSRVAQALFF